MATAHMKWAAVMRLLRKGLVTQAEAADLAGTSVYVIKEWAQRERIDIATTRATYLLTVWQSELAVERAKRWTERELISEQTRLDRAWEKHGWPANSGYDGPHMWRWIQKSAWGAKASANDERERPWDIRENCRP
jgi:hypothetical protein